MREREVGRRRMMEKNEGRRGRRERERERERERKRGAGAWQAQTHLALLLVASCLQKQDLSRASVCESLICINSEHPVHHPPLQVANRVH